MNLLSTNTDRKCVKSLTSYSVFFILTVEKVPTKVIMKPFPLCLPLESLSLAIELTQKTDPQYSSRGAAPMVHTDGFGQPQMTRQPGASFSLFHWCWGRVEHSYLLPPTRQRQSQDVTVRDFEPWGFQAQTFILLVHRRDNMAETEKVWINVSAALKSCFWQKILRVVL